MKNQDNRIFEAVFSGNMPVLKKLLNENPRLIEMRDRDNRTALFHAVIDGQTEIAIILLSAGSDVCVKDSYGKTPLHYAASENRKELAEKLIKCNAEVDAQDLDGNTPLSDAVFYSDGKGDLIKLLLKHGADKDKQNYSGVSPFALAKSISNYDLTKFFEGKLLGPKVRNRHK